MAIAGRKTDPTVVRQMAKTKDALITERVVRRILSELGAKMTAPVKALSGGASRSLLIGITTPQADVREGVATKFCGDIRGRDITQKTPVTRVEN